MASRKAGGIRNAARTNAPKAQVFRGLLLALEILVAVKGFVVLGLVESHAVFAVYPLLIAALSGPVLGERVGWRRWVAIGIGFIGVLVILWGALRRSIGRTSVEWRGTRYEVRRARIEASQRRH